MPVQISTIKTDAFEMDYIRFGAGKTPFVILPGLSVQSVMGAAELIAKDYGQLAEACTVYVFDRRRELPDAYAVHEMAMDTAAAFRALGLEHINLFGASQGGMIAMELTIAFPQLVDKLVLGSTSACIGEGQYRIIEDWICLAKEKNAEELYLTFGEAVYPQQTFEQFRGLLIEAAKTVTKADLERFVVLAGGMRGFDISDQLGKINCPVLVIGAKDDRVLGADAAETIGKYLTHSSDLEMHLYEGYGHAAYDTAPDYKERIRRFLLK